ncbi:hypothetical protein [Streptomyces lancefieldiae]|uniref:Uncharacterized protein n=1 Tax=Streptomyces lancefieldiae TaxID=3075520 RepID=A0ABU3AJE4_9ACTN|nr:hypothetical protein [Streptomyces sp. DSM 40712]MDT0610109.1 hypothetical protein [Streptomyces sp. DSM 40712]
MDLLDWHRGRLSSRRLAVLVKHMPRDSALAQELHGDGAEWGVTDYLLAAAVDHLAAANWMFASVNSDEDSEPPEPPVPVPRPDAVRPAGPPEDEEPAPPEMPDRTDLLRFFA